MVRRATKEESIVDEFVASVKREMERKQVGPTELARVAGIGRQYLHRILSGECVPTIVKADKIANALGMRIKVAKLK